MHTFSAPPLDPAATPLPLRKLSQLPETGFVRLKQLLEVLPFSRSTLWRRVAEGTFPRPGKLSARITVWRTEDIHAWAREQDRTAFGAAMGAATGYRDGSTSKPHCT